MHGIHRQIHTSPFFYKASRVARWRRVPREVPTPIAHGRCAPSGGGSEDIYKQCLDILEAKLQKDHVVHFHCFLGSLEMANRFIKHFVNGFIGVTGARNNKFKEAIAIVDNIDIHRLTADAPHFGRPRMSFSSPSDVVNVMDSIADRKGLDRSYVRKIFRRNINKIYRF